MPILEHNKALVVEVVCVRELHVGVPCERLTDLKRFYAELLGLKPWAGARQIPGGWGVGNSRRGLLLVFQHDPEVDPVRRRFSLLVDSLAKLEERLVEAEYAYNRTHGFYYSDQYISLLDPAGHRLEFRQSQQL